MRAGAERLARVDHELEHARPRGRLPHGGRTQSRPPTSTGSWKRFQRSAQSSGTGLAAHAARSTPPTSASPSGNDGSSPGAP